MYLVSGYYSLASGYYITRNAENISPLSFIFQVEKAKLLTKNREASAFGVCSSQNAPGMISFHREVQVVSQITPALRSPEMLTIVIEISLINLLSGMTAAPKFRP